MHRYAFVVSLHAPIYRDKMCLLNAVARSCH